MTNNGEKASHEYVAKQLRRLTAKHIRVYVVPGNHDLNNPHRPSLQRKASI
ncbi:MAG: metallophosphoesterase [Lactiplantibacillus plantarum]|nr:metallophosphoesterase [Lactiplantibacillus plantarum]